jgi:hypothetical protein
MILPGHAEGGRRGPSLAGDDLAVHLQALVPVHIDEVRGLPAGERQRIARVCSSVVSGQGDILQYGSSARYGHGAKELAAHQAHRPVVTAEDRAANRCPVCVRGQATYSPGEVFSFLARGLAVLACQPGGVTFAGQHWCAHSHPWCPARPGGQPGSCTCPAESWRENGCYRALEGQCGEWDEAKTELPRGVTTVPVTGFL